jgi:hypothetical protein
MKVILVAALSASFLCNVSFGQKITGKVADEKGVPLEFANVVLLKDSIATNRVYTDSVGNYIFSGVSTNSYVIQASLVGYLSLSKSFYLGTDTIVDFQLVSDSGKLKSVTVIGKKPLIEKRIDRLIFNIDGNLNFAGLDAMDALMRAPLLDVRDNTIKRIGGMPMRVMIDGRLLGYLDPASIANKLRSIPAEGILRVEIITNPGEEYDAEGGGGLVNIVLKKVKKLGYNGSITTAYTRINQDDLYRINFDFNYNIKNIRTFFSFGTSTGRALTVNDITIFYPSYTWNSQGYHFEYQKPYFTTIGFEYDLSKKSSFGISFSPLLSYPDQEGAYSILVSDPANNQKDSTISTSTASKISYKNYAVNLHYNHALDTTGGQLTIDFDWVKNRFGKDVKNNSETYSTSGSFIPSSKFQYLSLNADQPELITFNAVFKLPKKRYTLTYGTKFTFVNSTQTLNQYRILDNPVQTEILTDNSFNAKQNIQAIFGGYQRTLKKLEFKAGLRAEYTQLNWNIPNSASSGSKKYFNVFPNANLGYQVNKKSSISLGFNRRFSRPSFSSLNPTLVYVDTYRFYRGNSDLSPYFTNTLELSYTYAGNLTLGLGYSSTPHSIYSLPDVKSNSNVIVDILSNYISSRYYSFDCFYNFDRIKNLQSTFQTSIYNSGFSSALLQTASNNNKWSGTFRTSNTYFFNKKRTLIGGVIFNYQLADASGISIIKDRYYLDVSLRYSLFDRKLDISFNGRDIFKTNNFYSSTVVNGIQQNSFVNDRSRRFGLTVKYNFGNSKIKKGAQYNGVGSDQSIIAK